MHLFSKEQILIWTPEAGGRVQLCAHPQQLRGIVPIKTRCQDCSQANPLANPQSALLL